MGICDYSTYYQPVVMGDLFGFGKPLDHPAFLGSRASSTAWGRRASARSPASASPSTSR